MCTVCAPYAGNIASSVGVACTRTFTFLMSAMLWISFLPYRLRRPSVSKVRQCASFTVSANIARIASTSAGVATPFTK